MQTGVVTLNFANLYTVNFRITNDLLEDSQFDLVALHVQEAGRQVGEKASDLAITVLGTGTDGDGTMNATNSTTANTSKWYDATATTDDVMDSIAANAADGFTSDTLVTTHHSMVGAILQTTGIGAGNEAEAYNNFMLNGWPTKLGPLNVVYNDGSWISHALAFTTCHNIICSKNYSMVSGRKRWMRLEKYSEPVKDLTGAVISFRQDSKTIYNDSICLYSEV
jgi:hypothetical protein